MSVGQSVPRIDAFDKVTGRTKYTEDLISKNAYVAKVLHATIAHGLVTGIDLSEAEKIPGVIAIATCFTVPQNPFPTAGHPWSTDVTHQDVADRLLLNRHVRYYGDDIAAVVATDEVIAAQALRAIKVEYEQWPHVLSVEAAMKSDAPQIHEEFSGNILKHTSKAKGDFEAAVSEPGLLEVEGWYHTPTVQHCHIEPPISFAYKENGRIVIVSSTQIPHIVRRVVGQALGLPWGRIRVIKPYIGGGFGNKQDVLYEPLNAYLTTLVGGHPVALALSREETFFSTRVRHGIDFHLKTWLRQDGRIVARSCEAYSDQGAYASHGHSIVSKAITGFMQLYDNEHVASKGEAYTVFTNKPAAGAMRGYGMPQSIFAVESHTEDIAQRLQQDPIAFRRKNMMPVGYTDGFSKNVNYFDTFNQCMEKGMKAIGWEEKRQQYQNQTGLVRRGVGMSLLWYNTGVWPIALESSSCRMIMNQDGSIQLQLAETEIGQGADTAFAQMAASALGIPLENVHVMSNQDTDITPFGTGAYASRQTYVGGMAIHQTAEQLRHKVLAYASGFCQVPVEELDIVDGNIVRGTEKQLLLSLAELATEALYSLEKSEQFSAEITLQCKSNAYSFGCAFAEVEVDLGLGKVTLLNLVNVHDCGSLINPQLAKMQVQGGMSMAIGYGLSEKMLFDEKTGRLLNDNFLDYKLATTLDHPDLTAHFVENPEPTSPFGTKALGEPPVVPGAPAIRNAVLHATGIAMDEIPLTPHNLFPKFKEAGLL